MVASQRSCRRALCAVVLPIGLVVFLGHFLRLSEFGLYEDDYRTIAPNLTRPVADLSDAFAGSFRYWPQGRPRNHFLPVALSVIGHRIGGLAGVYALGCAWLTLNAVLVHVIARRFIDLPAGRPEADAPIPTQARTRLPETTLARLLVRGSAAVRR